MGTWSATELLDERLELGCELLELELELSLVREDDTNELLETDDTW